MAGQVKPLKLFNEKPNVLLYIIIPLCLGFLIVKFNYLYVISVFAVLLFFYFKPRMQFYIYFLSVFYPLILTVGPINELPFSFIIIPLFFSSMLVSMIAKKQKIFPRNNRIFVFSLLLLLFCIFIGYAKNSFSVFSIDLENHESKMIAESYLTAFAGIMIFFSTLWFSSAILYDENKLLRFFIFSALFFAFIRLMVHFLGYDPPFFSSAFKYIAPSGALRLGGFDICVGVGVPALIAYSSDRLNILRVLLMLVFLILGILGGGRALFSGVLFSLIIYLSLFYKKNSAKFLLTCGVFIVTVALVAQYVSLPVQVERITGVTLFETGFVQDDPERASVYSYYWDTFLKNPLFGKGIGTYEGRIAEFPWFVEEQLIYGGHGSYMSILCIFGVGGAAFLCIMLFGGIIKVYRLILRSKLENLSFPYQKSVLFIMLYLVATAIYYITAGAGYKDLKLYFVVGMLLGIIEKNELIKSKDTLKEVE